MEITASNWSNKKGTANRSCGCGTWKKHWLNYSNKSWPASCSVNGCSTTPSLGAHVINQDVSGEKIISMCNSCNGLDSKFNLVCGVTLVSANKSETCA